MFDDGDRLTQLLVDALPASPLPTPTLSVDEALRHVLTVLAADMQPRRAQMRVRSSLISQHVELAERELWKMHTWAQALVRALIDRGVDDFTATVAAEVALAIFRAAFLRWLTDDGPDLTRSIDEAYAAINR